MKTFNSIVTEHLGVPEQEIVDTLTAKDVPDWDSMSYLLFIADIEKNYGIKFTMSEVLSANSIGAVKKVIESKGVTL